MTSIFLDKISSNRPKESRVAHVINQNVRNAFIAKKSLIDGQSHKNGIGIKKSRDLKHWTDWGNLITLGQKEWNWGKGRVTAATVLDLRHIDGINKYLMFFHASGPLTEEEGDFDKNSSIGLAWSSDLQNWNWVR